VQESPLAPALLVAMPQLADPNFHRATVLLIEHGDQGTFGLVLNRPTDLLASELCGGLDIEWRGASDVRVGSGGPCQPETGWLIFQGVEGVDAQPVHEGIHFARSIDALRRIAEDPPNRTRLFVGYSGWGPGQLEQELAAGAWLVAPISVSAVFDEDHDTLWERVVRGLGIDPATLVHTSGVH
jgi:putative transcriptional regulator